MLTRKWMKSTSRFIFTLLFLSLSSTSFAIGNFDSASGRLLIPEIDMDGKNFFNNVSIKFDFPNGTFDVVSLEEKPPTIFETPIDSFTDQDVKMGFLGCARTGRNEVSCHMELTSLGGFDQSVIVYASQYQRESRLFDDLGNTYIASEVIVGNLQGSRYVTSLLIAGVPTLAKFKFKNILPSASSISLFKPSFRNRSKDKLFNGDFRNIQF